MWMGHSRRCPPAPTIHLITPATLNVQAAIAVTAILFTGTSPVALAIHAWALPALFYAALVLHIGAVLKRHFGARDASAVHRMLR